MAASPNAANASMMTSMNGDSSTPKGRPNHIYKRSSTSPKLKDVPTVNLDGKSSARSVEHLHNIDENRELSASAQRSTSVSGIDELASTPEEGSGCIVS